MAVPLLKSELLRALSENRALALNLLLPLQVVDKPNFLFAAVLILLRIYLAYSIIQSQGCHQGVFKLITGRAFDKKLVSLLISRTDQQAF